MTTAPCQSKTSSFFYLLQTTPGLDKRDNRGKIHDMAFVITGLTLAICCGRDGGLSRLHRHMGNHFAPLCLAIQTWPKRVISRAQLPLLRAKVGSAAADPMPRVPATANAPLPPPTPAAAPSAPEAATPPPPAAPAAAPRKSRFGP